MADESRRRIDERRAAIEAKRKRLDDIRKSKSSVKSVSKSTPKIQKDKNAGLDNLIEELLSKPAEVSKETSVDTQPNNVEVNNDVKRNVKLTRVSDIGTVNIPQTEFIAYSKEVQTDDAVILLEEEQPQSPRTFSRKSFDTVEYPEVQGNFENSNENLEEKEIPPLEEEELVLIDKDKTFQSFLQQGIRVVERAMKQNAMFDVAIDYGGIESTMKIENVKAKLLFSITDEKWGKDRTITGIEFSPHHKELFLTSYSKKHANTENVWSKESQGSPGLVLVWSMHMIEEGPEYVFTCDSPIETAKFHPYAPNIVVGGTYTGQIVMWDLRSKGIPIQRSLLTIEGHSHPVYCMTITGSVNAHTLVSLSTDGQLCLWSLHNIASPSESKQLKWEKKEIATTALAFPAGESNEMFVGSEDGRIFKVQVHGSRAGVQSQIQAHNGPITKLHFHSGANIVGDLMLSCSMDWRVKLWSNRSSDIPLLTFSASSDYVYDVQWNPVHPAVFASVDGSGILDIWNLNTDMEIPYARIHVNNGDLALSSVCWSPDAKKIFVTDSQGTIFIYEVAPELHAPKKDELIHFENRISHLVEKLDESVPAE